MNGLALLCNLFADGPVTLKRLRAARVTSLGELERQAPEHLAEWLHASIPQARAFADEGRKLARRLAEDAPAVLEPVPAAPLTRPAPSGPAQPAETTLTAGLFPGLTEPLCARLAQNRVRTVRALSEFAGMALARRSGIPYSTLLELAREARRFQVERGRERRAPQEPPAALPARAESLRPDAAPARHLDPFAVPESDLAKGDSFTLPAVEPGSAGPFV